MKIHQGVAVLYKAIICTKLGPSARELVERGPVFEGLGFGEKVRRDWDG